ncbi:MAG: NADH dehydrogenase-like protein [Turneriella sp.]|nr:NADH dehydrogenase-like protein [Turneriella sp.]
MEDIRVRRKPKHLVWYRFSTRRTSVSVENQSTSCAIAGGGYAGLATAIELHRYAPHIRVTLFDKRKNHQKLTQWHKLARGKNIKDFEVPFQSLAQRFKFTFVQQDIDLDKLLQKPHETLLRKFDAVVVAQGSLSPHTMPGVVTLDMLRDDPNAIAKVRTIEKEHIAVVGAGPTGVQFAFELAARGNKVELIEAQDRVLPSFDASVGECAVKEAQKQNITLHLNTEFIRFEKPELILRKGNETARSTADYVLFVPGVRANPAFNCDLYGRITEISGERPECLFYAAGDNSYFSGRGLNAKSAQAAVRKGQAVARTLAADLSGKAAPEYVYQELGYFVSLGPKNAVGYLLSQKSAFSGRGALFMKEAVEKQYDLYLNGLPVYL